jgi:hypothetical protein
MSQDEPQNNTGEQATIYPCPLLCNFAIVQTWVSWDWRDGLLPFDLNVVNQPADLDPRIDFLAGTVAGKLDSWSVLNTASLLITCSSHRVPPLQSIEWLLFLEMCGSIGAAGLLAGQPLDTGPSHFHSHSLILIFIFVHLIHLGCIRAAYFLILHTGYGMWWNSIVKVRFQSPQYKGRYPSTWSAIRESSCLSSIMIDPDPDPLPGDDKGHQG